MPFMRRAIFPIYCAVFLSVSHAITADAPSEAFCSKTSECIVKLKKAAAETNRFWFGDQWRLNCAGVGSSRYRAQNPIQCLNPRELVNFHSLGSRLYRVNTFTAAYLRNLRIFPRITFTPEKGSYRACEHDFDVFPPFPEIEAHPNMDPIDPFWVRAPPDISWPELSDEDSLILLLLDVGFGTLKFLSTDFPRATKVLHAYEPVENFRPGQPTPMVLLVFETTKDHGITPESVKADAEKLFDLTEFIIRHGLENNLIGMNWVVVGADAYAMERQRLRGSVDNCHSLIHKKLMKDRRWDFVDMFPLYEMDSSMSISYQQPEAQLDVCCTRVSVEEETVFADPLDDRQLPSLAVRQPPVITALRSVEQTSDGYQRSLRHYVVMKEDRFSLVLIDPNRGYLYWMLVDIPSAALAAGTLAEEALKVAPYLPPIPGRPNTCLSAVFMLFRQPLGTGVNSELSDMADFYNQDHALRSKQCIGHCQYRNSFDIAQFKSFHRLRLSGVSWMRVCYDVHEAARQIQLIRTSNLTLTMDPAEAGKTWPSPYENGRLRRTNKVENSDEVKRQQIDGICTQIRPANIECTSGANVDYAQFSLIVAFILLTLRSFA
ncbi:Protein C56G2.4 [Aphelenchoides avenae]|nr:Protein C56G2.4 [Aphelenchus avenae]